MEKIVLQSRGFRALLAYQFLGAFGYAILFSSVFGSLLGLILDPPGAGGNDSLMASTCCLILLLLCAFGGVLGDRFSKTSLLRAAKLGEFALIVFVLLRQDIPKDLPILFFDLALAALYAVTVPARFALMPELLADEDLSRGNGQLEFANCCGLIFGTAALPLLLAGNPYYVLLLGAASIAAAASLLVPKTQSSAEPAALRVDRLNAAMRSIRESKELSRTLAALVYFWALAAFVMIDLMVLTSPLHIAIPYLVPVLMAVLPFGFGCGSLFAGKESEGRVEIGLVPIGIAAVGFAIFRIDIFAYHFFLVVPGTFFLGFSGGVFVIPLRSYFQQKTYGAGRAAAISVLVCASMFGGALAYVLLFASFKLLGISPAVLLAAAGFSAFAVCVAVCRVIPDMLLRCMNWLMTHILYKVQVVGRENLPKDGGGLIICNHVTYVDPSLLLAITHRPVRFLMDRGIHDAKYIHPIVSNLGVIPIDKADSPKDMLRSLGEAREAIQKGELVCVFAEGELTRVGHLLNFKKGFERIMKGVDAPIIPVYIDQIWGSIFSYRDGKFFWKIPRELPYPVTIAFGKPLAANAKAYQVRQSIQDLSAEMASTRRARFPTLHSAFIRSCKRRLFANCMVDSAGKRLSYFGALGAALALRKKFLAVLAPNKMVGVMLPPSIGGAITNIALPLSARIPVNLNFTASKDSIAYAIQKCELGNVITTRPFLEKIGMEPLPGTIYFEDLIEGISAAEKLCWGLAGLLIPQQIFERWVLKDNTGRGDLATVIFSSGSTAEPKGVMLTHGNISSNIESMYEIFQLDGRDAVLGVLPFFHSFGYTATLWLPLICGIRSVYHPNPMDAQIIGELVQKEKVTLLMSTPTFLLGYIRRCSTENFASLRFVVVGAEKLKDRIAQAFFEKFKIMPLEGYGATELSPVAMINVPNFRSAAIQQVGHKPGTVGHPLPGVSVRIVNLDTFEDLGVNCEGLMLVRGPNVMKGYLSAPEKTAEAIRDGWYITGDIAKVDEDGFVTITDRLSRFSKIAGEMVPHVKIEEAIHQAMGEK